MAYFFENINRISFWEEYVSLFSGTLLGIPVLFFILFAVGLHFKFKGGNVTAYQRLPAWIRKFTLKPDIEESVHANKDALSLPQPAPYCFFTRIPARLTGFQPRMQSWSPSVRSTQAMAACANEAALPCLNLLLVYPLNQRWREPRRPSVR